jgi:hypothetical protein
VDKSLLVAGEAEIKFGGGSIKQPMNLVIGDRATFEANGIKIPVKEIAVQTAKEWFKKAILGIWAEHSVPIVLRLSVNAIKNTGAIMADLLMSGFSQRMGATFGTYSTINNSSLTQNLYVSTAAPVSTVVQDFGMMRALAGV